MRAIVSGSHGTVAPYLIKELKNRGIDVIVFDRNKVDILSYDAVYNFIKESKCNLFFHLATGDLKWISNIVEACKDLTIKVIYTSSVSVYNEEGTGPYQIDDIPIPNTEYGKYKYEGEKIVLTNRMNLVARLGWQIGYEINTNNMYDYLVKQYQNEGIITASKMWYPSCSFIDDTAFSLSDLALNDCKGIYLINSNISYNFYEIVCNLKKKYNTNWQINSDTSFARDDRMFDDRVKIKKFSF